MGEESESRHAKMPPGWKRQSLQLPIPLAHIWTQEAGAKGTSSIKVMGTASIALLLGMPAELRDALYLHVQRMTWNNGVDVSPEELWAAFREMLRAHEEGLPLAPSWHVSRIADPELTPPRGQKASDRPIVQRSGRAKGA